MIFSTIKSFLILKPLLRPTLSIALCLVASAAVICQTEGSSQNPVAPNKSGQPEKSQPAKPKLPFTLRITNDQIIGISLKAQDVKLKEITTELSRRLKTPIFVTAILEKHQVTTNFNDLVLEPAMQMLAPQVYIDYEVDSTPGKQPRPVGIYLQGYNEPAPADNAVVKGNSDVMVIEGNTEDTPESIAQSEQELKVTYEKGNLSVKAKQEPLIAVLYGIANELGIPLEVKNEVSDLVTVNIAKSSVEYALQQLGPNIRLYIRTDLQIQEKRPLRLVLVAPDKKS